MIALFMAIANFLQHWLDIIQKMIERLGGGG